MDGLPYLAQGALEGFQARYVMEFGAFRKLRRHGPPSYFYSIFSHMQAIYHEEPLILRVHTRALQPDEKTMQVA